MNQKSQQPLTHLRHQFSYWPWVAILLTAIVGLGTTGALWHMTIAAETRSAEETFYAQALTLHQSVVLEIDLFMDVLNSLRELHHISDSISPEAFQEFVQKGLLHQRHILTAFGFAQRISESLRQPFEATAPGVSVVEPDATGGFRPADNRSQYAPLTYQDPKGGLHVPLGFDFGAQKANEPAIIHMLSTGQSAVGGKVMSSHANGNNQGYYVFAPILYPTFAGQPVPPPGYLVGFTIAILQPQTILRHASEKIHNHSIQLSLSQLTSTEEHKAPPQFAFEELVDIADQTWVLRCEAGPEYLRTQLSRQPNIVMFAGLIITALITLLLASMATKARKIAVTVQSRTAALQATHQQLEAEMKERMRLQGEILNVSGQEKYRVGRDLHDSIGQKLTGAIFLSRALLRKFDEDTPQYTNVEQINTILKESVGSIRRIAKGLAPVELDEAGLPAALDRLADDTHDIFNVECHFSYTQPPNIPNQQIAIHLHQIAAEAVNNAVRHGKPKNINISLSPERLVVIDDGSGFTATPGDASSMGLRIMRYRAEMIGASLEVTSDTKQGTVIACVFKNGLTSPPDTTQRTT